VNYLVLLSALGPFDWLTSPIVLVIGLPIVFVLGLIADKITGTIIHHRERIAKIEQGIDPDEPPRS
jgi:hypothetical protein